MLEDPKNNEPLEIVKSSEPQTCQIFVGGLRRPPQKQNDNPEHRLEKASERADE
jgi:hypothetical protein